MVSGVSPRAAGRDRVAEGFTDGAGVLAATEGLLAPGSAGARCAGHAARAARRSARPLATGAAARGAAGTLAARATARGPAGAFAPFTADGIARGAALCSTADPAHAPCGAAGASVDGRPFLLTLQRSSNVEATIGSAALGVRRAGVKQREARRGVASGVVTARGSARPSRATGSRTYTAGAGA